jgi:hypothetical protein
MYDFQRHADDVQQAYNKSDLIDFGGILEHDKSKQNIQSISVIG